MLTERFEQALIFASRAHARQKRKGCDVPYLAHLMSVAALVLEHGGHEHQAIAALLHDAVEDQGGPAMHKQITEAFGPQVASIVDGCTDAVETPKPPWLSRKRRFIDRLHSEPPDVRLVVTADKLHNVRTILSDFRLHGPPTFTRFRGGLHGTVWYYRAVTDALRAAQSPVAPPMLDELERNVAELERLTRVPGRSVDITQLLT
jgi:(p)ppGpp synthase/HD superfamily hydrolase